MNEITTNDAAEVEAINITEQRPLGQINVINRIEHELFDSQTGEPIVVQATPPAEPQPISDGVRVKLGEGGKALNSGVLNIGTVTVEMPSEEEQRAGFATPYASALATQFPQYKLYKPKG